VFKRIPRGREEPLLLARSRYRHKPDSVLSRLKVTWYRACVSANDVSRTQTIRPGLASAADTTRHGCGAASRSVVAMCPAQR
jgi:hypothetical protein